jgi:hypothetical protein
VYGCSPAGEGEGFGDGVSELREWAKWLFRRDDDRRTEALLQTHNLEATVDALLAENERLRGELRESLERKARTTE